jgi:hypothetical protein
MSAPPMENDGMLNFPIHGGPPCTRYAMRPRLWTVGVAACLRSGNPVSPAGRSARPGLRPGSAMPPTARSGGLGSSCSSTGDRR